jgi:hypothetical protein
VGDDPPPGLHVRVLWIAAALLEATIVTLAGCSHPPPNLSASVPNIDELQAVDIRDAIRGPQAESKLFPIEARYSLQRGSSGFVGQGIFAVGSVAPRRATANVLVPFDAMRDFLQAVSSLSIRPGYEPQTPQIGGAFPDVRIELKDRSRTIALFTRSPGAGFLPWGVELEGRDYTIESNAPPKAFEALHPYLKRDVLDRLTQAATSSGAR